MSHNLGSTVSVAALAVAERLLLRRKLATEGKSVNVPSHLDHNRAFQAAKSSTSGELVFFEEPCNTRDCALSQNIAGTDLKGVYGGRKPIIT